MAASDEDIAKLMAKGASLETAVAALEATGSVHDAADAIAQGVFGGAAVDNKNAQEIEDSDDELSDGGSVGGFSDVIVISDDDEEDADSKPGMPDQDPYSSINMKKDRKEKVIESIQEPKTISIEGREVPGQGTPSLITCTEITASDWQRGVGHGSEQSFLFDVYRRLVVDAVSCPKQSCRQSYPRIGYEFLVLFPNLSDFLDHIERTLPKHCHSCSTVFCRACGGDWQEHLKTAKDMTAAVKPQGGSLSKGKPASASPTPDASSSSSQAAPNASWPLLHCNLTLSMVLGVGLAHVERLLLAKEDSNSNGEKTDSPKRRKVEDGSASSASSSTSASPASAASSTSSAGFSASLLPAALGLPASSAAAASSAYYAALHAQHHGKGSGKAGTGYGGGRDDYSWQQRAAQQQLQKDEKIRSSLAQLRAYLPDERREYVRLNGSELSTGPIGLDHMPDLSNLAHLRRRFLPIASTLLSTGSIMDVTERLPLFEELMTWMRMLSRHHATAPLVAQPIMRLQHTEIHNNERVSNYVGSAGPRELAQPVYDQAQVLVKNIQKAGSSCADTSSRKSKTSSSSSSSRPGKRASSTDLKSVEADRTLTLCKSIIEDVDAIDRSLLAIKGKGFLTRFLSEIRGGAVEIRDEDWDENCERRPRELSDEEVKANYQTWARRLIYQEADMTAKTTGSGSKKQATWAHTYASLIQETRELTDSKRNLIIAKELAGLAASLPADWHCSIFVRVDESRFDVLRAALTGPPSSPYANGIFLFDIFLPREYNQQPPKVSIITTNGGQVRFGPNLYACGKVCLSLLGTWSGPGWVAGRSTLLQVLLSLSSLVMAEEEPAVNEPGWSSYRGTAQSHRYTKNLRRQTVRHAMLGMLNNLPEPWEEVIQGHFRQKRTALIKQLDEWLKEDDKFQTVGDGASVMHGGATATPGGNGFEQDIEALKKLLNEL